MRKNIWKHLLVIFCHYFICIATVKPFNLHVYCRLFSQSPFSEMPSLIPNENYTYDNCGTQTTKLNPTRHKKWCSVETIYSIHCPNFSTKSQNYLNYLIAKKHSAPKPDVTIKCNFVNKSFQDFTLYDNIKKHPSWFSYQDNKCWSARYYQWSWWYEY